MTMTGTATTTATTPTDKNDRMTDNRERMYYHYADGLEDH